MVTIYRIDKNWFSLKIGIFASLLVVTTVSWGQVANFEADFTEGCVPLVVKFIDQSSGNPTAWEWDFGTESNNASQLQNPSNIYTLAGTYKITLISTFIDGSSDTKTKVAYIRVHAAPKVSFNADITSGCSPLEVNFTNTSVAGEGVITDWTWVFGDGGVSYQESPMHIYKITGKKSIALVVTNSSGCITKMPESDFINVEDIVMNFSTLASCDVSAKVSFTNLSTGGDGQENYLWDFGNGNTSTTQNAQHTYAQLGTYPVSLSIIGKSNCAITRELQVGAQPSPDFRATTQALCVGETVVFENLDPNTTSLEWDWGDGRSQTATSNSVSTTYSTASTYNVTLTATYAGGCTGKKTKQIKIIEPPNVDFSISGCEDKKSFTFIKEPNKVIISWEWEFGDSHISKIENPTHIYVTKDNFMVKLSVIDNIGCHGEVMKNNPVFDKPIANFIPNQLSTCQNPLSGETAQSLGGCAPHTIKFESRNNFGIPETEGTTIWTFGNEGKSIQANPTYTFVNTGDYDVTLTIENIIGCKDQMIKTVKVTDVLPESNFSLNKNMACIGEKVEFTNLSINANAWCWTVDRDSIIIEESPIYAFTTLGSQDIKLTAQNDGCSTSIILSDIISIVGAIPDFEVIFGCEDPYTIQIDNTSKDITQGVDTWIWNFGDNNAHDQSYNPSHRYDATGEYIVTLTTHHIASNCTFQKIDTIQIVDLEIDFSATPQIACKNTTIHFEDKSQFAKSIYWSMPGADTLPPIKESDPFYRNPHLPYSKPGQYNVALEGIDVHGCVSRKMLLNFITIIDLEGNFSYEISESRCDELDVVFTDLSRSNIPISDWNWSFGDGSTSNKQNPSHTYTALGQYDVLLTLTNQEGQCSTNKFSLVNFINPEPDFVINRKAYCINELIGLTNNSKNASTYRWEIEGQSISVSSNPIVQYDNTGSFDVALTATDAWGCSKTITKADAIQITSIIADFTASKVLAKCPPLITSFTAIASGGVARQWEWAFGDGVGHSTIEQPTYVYFKAGTYTVSLRVISEDGCRSEEISKDAFIHVNGPDGTVSIQPSNGCVGMPITFESTITNAIKNMWNFGDGGTSTAQNTTHIYSNATSYLPILQLEGANGCVVLITPSNNINISPIPEIDFYFAEPNSFPKEEITFTAVGDKNIQWVWGMENEDQYTGSEVTHAFSTSGLLPVRLSGTNQIGCTNIIDKEIYIQQDISFTPNVFTPNGDKKNSVFKILDIHNGIWDIILYNRYGARVYEMRSYDNSWTGGDSPTGVYYYNLTNRYRNRSYKGYVHLLR